MNEVRIYVANAGDTLYKIANQNQIDIAELLSLNSYITDPNQSLAGRQVRLPYPMEFKTKFINLTRKWKIFVIHNSHTDVGYTDRQEKIEQFHVGFIRQAIAIAEAAQSGQRQDWQGFKWTCETFWAVERFLEKASPDERERFAEQLRRGDIELSGNYLNMTELIDYDILCKKLKAANAYANTIGVEVDSAMTADINGYSWGYAQALYDAGIRNLLSCVHTHHGMFPVGRKQTPFYWETPKGDWLLVWNGEHYMMGNDLGLCPGAVLSYTIHDEFDSLGTTMPAKDHWKLAETRIERYLRQLESEGYPYDFALVNVSGLLMDNAPPNGVVAAFIQEWNERHGNSVEIEMTTLSRYFGYLREQNVPIPMYRGDWPDWWTDGTISTAMHTQVFRDAQRTLKLIHNIGEVALSDSAKLAEAEYQLMLYAEHTWGYHSSVIEPWHPLVQALVVRKEAYAANASQSIYELLYKALERRGEATLAAGVPFRYKVINPYKNKVSGIVLLKLMENWGPSLHFLFPDGFEVYEESTLKSVPYQLEEIRGGNQISIFVELEPKEERYYRFRSLSEHRAVTTSSTRLKGLDGIYDLHDLYPAIGVSEEAVQIVGNTMESPHVRVEWDGRGIISWIDKKTGRELIRTDSPYPAFTPVYEITEAGAEDKMADVRRRMGRNRKGPGVRRYAGRLKGVHYMEGTLYTVAELKFELEGMSHYSLYLKAYRDLPRVDVAVRLNKDSVWDPENVYISLPFRPLSEDGQLWLDKAGAPVRPGIDQLLGTCIDYYCVQEGVALLSDAGGLVLSTPDTPLLQTGPLEYGIRQLNGQQSQDAKPNPLYAWVQTNYWETNFKATLGGFYEFRYRLQWGEEWNSPEKALRHCLMLNTELPAFRTNNPKCKPSKM